MTDKERIEKLEKENEIMKKILTMFISHIRADGDISYFSQESQKVMEDLFKQLIMWGKQMIWLNILQLVVLSLKIIVMIVFIIIIIKNNRR